MAQIQVTSVATRSVGRVQVDEDHRRRVQLGKGVVERPSGRLDTLVWRAVRTLGVSEGTR